MIFGAVESLHTVHRPSCSIKGGGKASGNVDEMKEKRDKGLGVLLQAPECGAERSRQRKKMVKAAKTKKGQKHWAGGHRGGFSPCAWPRGAVQREGKKAGGGAGDVPKSGVTY